VAAGGKCKYLLCQRHALANRWRRAENLMRVPCLSQELQEGDHLSRKQAQEGPTIILKISDDRIYMVSV